MVKPCPGKTKEILKSSPAHCPPPPTPTPWKCQLCCFHALSQIYSGNIITSTDFEMYRLQKGGKKRKENEHTASRCVKRDGVDSAETDFKQAPAQFLIKAKRISQFTHLRDHRGFLCLSVPFDLCVCPLTPCLIYVQGEKNKHNISWKYVVKKFKTPSSANKQEREKRLWMFL